MARIRHTAEQIINKLREAEVYLGQGRFMRRSISSGIVGKLSSVSG